MLNGIAVENVEVHSMYHENMSAVVSPTSMSSPLIIETDGHSAPTEHVREAQRGRALGGKAGRQAVEGILHRQEAFLELLHLRGDCSGVERAVLCVCLYFGFERKYGCNISIYLSVNAAGVISSPYVAIRESLDEERFHLRPPEPHHNSPRISRINIASGQAAAQRQERNADAYNTRKKCMTIVGWGNKRNHPTSPATGLVV